MPPQYAPKLNLDIPDNRLAQAGYVRRWYPSDKDLWQSSTTTGLFRWPGARIVTLEPKYEPAPAEGADAQWTKAGTGSNYTTCTGLWGSTGPHIKQQAPGATGCTVTSVFTPEHNQPFFADLYLYDVTAETWYADLRFCRNWCLRLLYNGTMQVFRNVATPDQPDDWQYLQNLRTTDGVRNKHVRLAVYPTAHQELLLLVYGAEPQAIMVTDPLVTVDGDGVYYRNICEAAPVVLYVSGGSFVFGYRYMRFATSGSLTLPGQSLPWDYGGAFTISGQVGRNRTGYSPTATAALYDDEGNQILSPPDEAFRNFEVGIDLTSDDALFTPELNWAQLLINPTSEVNTPASPVTIDGPGEGLVSLSCGAELQGRRDARVSLANVDGTYSALWSRLRMCGSVQDASTGLVTYWKGYLNRTEAPQGSDDVRLELVGSDPLSRLDIPLSDAYIGDGQLHTDFMEQLFKRAGLAATDYSIAVDAAALMLPEALGEEEPLFQARDGKTIREMVQYICKVWSGWELFADAAGTIHYEPLTTTAAVQFTLVGQETSTPGQHKFYRFRPMRDESEFYNFIVAIGEGLSGDVNMAFYYDDASVSDAADPFYLGFEKLLLLVDPNLQTMEQVETALGYMVAEHAHPLEEADCDCAWHETLDVGDMVAVTGSAYKWRVMSLGRTWAPDARLSLRLRNTYVAVA